jgi:hypothetical protein
VLKRDAAIAFARKSPDPMPHRSGSSRLFLYSCVDVPRPVRHLGRTAAGGGPGRPCRFTTPLTRHLAVSALALFDFLPVPVDYVVVADGVERPIFSSLRLRPGLALELAVF